MPVKPLKTFLFSLLASPSRFSKRSRLPTLLVLAYSPLPPLATLHRLRTNVDKEILLAARRDTTTGSKHRITVLLKEEITSVERKLESAGRNIATVFSTVSTLATIVPAMLGVVAMFTEPTSAAAFILSLSFSVLALSVLGAVVYPAQLALPYYRKKWELLALLLTLPLSLVIGPLTALLAVSAPLSLLALASRRKALGELSESFEWLKGAASTPWSPLYGSGACVDALESQAKWELADSMRRLVLLAGTYGASDLLEDAVKVYGRLVGAVKELSAKGLEMLFYCLISAALGAAALGVSVSTFSLFATVPAGFMGINVGATDPEALRACIEWSLAVTSLGLSVLTAWSREGNPLYLSEYLPLLTAATLIGFKAGEAIML